MTEPVPAVESGKERTSSVWAWVFIVAGAVIGGLISEAVHPHAENHPWRVLVLLAVGAVVGGAVLLLIAAVLDLVALGLALLVFVLGGCGWGLVSGWDARDNYLEPYCRYAATSGAALERCLARVGSDDIDRLDTPAARFARDETTECGEGAGPLCREPGVAD